MSNDRFDAELPGLSEPPTRVRHAVVFVCVLMSTLLYLDRFCLSFAERYIKEDLSLSNTQVGYMLSAFFWSYALAQVPSGWFTDRFGARAMMTIYIVSWSLFTAATGLAQGLVFLIIMRLGFGVGQAGAYPTSASLLSKWIPFSSRGTASSLVALGGRVGGTIAPLLTAYLMVVFVPPQNPSLLTDHDLLSGKGPALCHKLYQHSSPPAERVWNLLPDDIRGLMQENDTKVIEAALEKLGSVFIYVIQRKLSGDAPLPRNLDNLGFDLNADDRRRLLAALNSVLDRRDFYKPGTFDSLNLAQEAVSLLRRLKKGDDLSSLEWQRLNRLLLEAAFPAEIGKIYVAGWRPMMLLYGVAGLFVAGLFWFVFRNRPQVHPGCNAAERALIELGRPAGAPSPHGKAGAIPWMRLLKSTSLWLDSLTQVGTNVGWAFLVTFLARYLDEVHHVEIITRAWMAGIPLAGGIVGMFLGGPLTDRLVARIGLKWGRRLPISVTRFLAAAAYVGCLWTDDPWVATAFFTLVAFFCDLGIAAIWAFKQDVGGRYVGSILGWGNMWGNLAAAMSPLLYNWVLTDQPAVKNWETMFLVCAGAFCLSGFAGMGIDATIPIAPPDEDDRAPPP